MDLIDRQAAIDALEKEKTYCSAYADGYTHTDYFKQYNMGLADGIKALNKLPSADTVEVVRCKYCDLWNDWDSAGKDSLGNHVCSCAYWTREDGPVVYTADNDFCSNGDRRGEEDEAD